jgi:hypothetical protein
MYLGLLNIITYNTGKNFVSKEFKEYTVIISIITKGMLVKAYNLIKIVECYYGLL